VGQSSLPGVGGGRKLAMPSTVTGSSSQAATSSEAAVNFISGPAVTTLRTNYGRKSISGREKNTCRPPAYRIIPLNVAHFVCDTIQNAQTTSRLLAFSRSRLSRLSKSDCILTWFFVWVCIVILWGFVCAT
jgi:hypothetical protein